MGMKINRKSLKKFFFRRRLNLMTLLIITLLSIIVTAACLITGFIPERVGILEIVTVLLIGLCIVQTYRMRSCFRTMKSFRGKRKKKPRSGEQP